MTRLSSAWENEDLAGVDIGDGYIAATRVAVRKGRVRVTHAGFIRMETGASDRLLVASLRKVWREGRIPTRTVGVCLRTPSLAIKRFSHPGVGPAEFERLLREDVEQMLQIPAAHCFMDWFPNPGPEAGDGEESPPPPEGVLAAAPRAEAQRYLDVLREAGLVPVIVDVGCIALANLFLSLHPEAGERDEVCLVNLSDHVADIALIGPGRKLFPRIILSLNRTWENALDYLRENLTDVIEYGRQRLAFRASPRLIFTGDVPFRDRLETEIGAGLGAEACFWNPLSGCLRGRGRQTFDIRAPGAARMAASLGLALRRA